VPFLLLTALAIVMREARASEADKAWRLGSAKWPPVPRRRGGSSVCCD